MSFRLLFFSMLTCKIKAPRFGTYVLRREGGTSCVALVAETPIYRLATCIDLMYDELFWGWNSSSWTDDLETALVGLVDAEEQLRSLFAMMSVMSPGGSQGVNDLQKSVSDDLMKALVDHSNASLGKIHSTLHQFLQMARMVPLGPGLVTLIEAFERAKCAGSPGLLAAIDRADKAMDAYGNYQILSCHLQAHDAHMQLLLSLKALLCRARGGDWSALSSFKSQISLSMMGQISLGARRIVHYPALSSPDQLANWGIVESFAETLCGGVIMVGSMLGHRMGNYSVDANYALLQAILGAGFGYAGSAEGALLALGGHERACLFLSDEDDIAITHDKLHKRSKECGRTLRKLAKEGQPAVSLRVNSLPLAVTVARLRGHHSDNNWVDHHVEACWQLGLERGTFAVVELFHGEDLVAADFGHIVAPAASFYVATRYHNHQSTISPGFLLAFLEARYLKSLGFQIWDLGQTDANPIMMYKNVCSRVVHRCTHLQRFRVAMATAKPPMLLPKSGVVIEVATDAHLFASTRPHGGGGGGRRK